ncbi:MAG TPA: Uma2 family endonuclease [Armatimonadota bacterium]|nr:Uma2 family endonuclease [Armatimonadota bacterium]
MSAVTHPTRTVHSEPAAVPAEEIWRLSVEQYHQMVRTGILIEDDPVELLDGLLVASPPKTPRHRLATQLNRIALERLVPACWLVDAHEPITTGDSEPEPDVAVVRGDSRQYLHRHPGPEDIGMVVEVAESSLPRDRGIKMRLYASAGIPVYWILNLAEGRLEVYSDPTGPVEAPGFRLHTDYSGTDEAPVVLDGIEIGRIPVRELLP